MAPKRNPIEDPPTASSTDEEEASSGGEAEEEEEEEAQKGGSSSEEEDDADDGERGSPLLFNRNLADNKHETADCAAVAVDEPTDAPLQQASDAASGSETETESDSETERRERVANRDFTAKAVVVKPVEQNRDSKNTKSSDSLASPGKSTNKRPSKTEESSKDTKRIKKDPDGKSGSRVVGMDEKRPGDDARKPYFQRLWSEDDEIAVLKGMIDFRSDTGVSPFDDMNGFYGFVKKSISFDVSKIQFMDKVRSLKKKYVNNLGKGKNGEDPSFAKPHDRKAFELSKSIWGTGGAVLESAVKSNGKSKKNQRGKMRASEALKQELFPSSSRKKDEENRRLEVNGGERTSPGMDRNDGSEMIPIDRIMRSLGADELSVKQGWGMVALEDKKRLEKRWKALQISEMSFLVQKSQFLNEVAGMIAEAIRSSD